MTDTRFPNRWFGSNPQAIPNHGKQLHPFSRDLPKDWRAAFADHRAEGDEQAQSDGSQAEA